MRLQLSHKTIYRYDRPLRSVVQSHRLTPVNSAGQTVVSWNVFVEDANQGTPFVDGAGDCVTTITKRGPLSELLIEVTGTIDTRDTSGVLKGHKESVSPMAYLRSTSATKADVALTELARDVVAKGKSGLEQAHLLSQAISDAIVYSPGATAEHTTAAEALGLGEGVCQDHAHALIAAALAVEMPARYVAGYLFSDAEGQAHEASHAWAEIWIDGLGWVGFDAANRCCPDDRYIRLGSGYDAVDAAPIRGVGDGVAAESMDVTVAVQSVQQ